MDQIVEFITNHWMLSAAWAGLFALLIVSFTSTSSKVIGNQQITTMMNRENAVVIDVRSKADFSKGHLLGSINIPVAKLKDAASEVENYRERPIILVDANGMQTSSSAQQLQKMGISQLYRMQGGIISWTNDNLPLSTK